MCRPVRCRQCGRTTWSGCGSHVAAVKASVAADQWCAGHPSTAPGATPGDGWLRRILGR
ncbi:hypothetical protein ACFQ0K_07000 [Nocardioides caeni]|uniref:hypothetical protein n=1 Tax=Nocardioides caeni TaxID=574700 RepID=UPI0013C2D153|nr:hypothetical protein [Nocardioides caeni]